MIRLVTLDFWQTLFADERGVRKPAAAMFRWVLAAAALDPARAVHVGDDAVADVGGARGAGMRAIHFVPDASVAGARPTRCCAGSRTCPPWSPDSGSAPDFDFVPSARARESSRGTNPVPSRVT